MMQRLQVQHSTAAPTHRTVRTRTSTTVSGRWPGTSSRPAGPSQAVFVDVGEHTGALVLHAPAEREGLEVEIHPVADPSRRTHVWVLPRAGRATVYAAVFPSLAAGDYAVLDAGRLGRRSCRSVNR